MVSKLNDSLNPICVGVHGVILMISIHSSDSSHLLLEIQLRKVDQYCTSQLQHYLSSFLAYQGDPLDCSQALSIISLVANHDLPLNSE